MPTRTTPFSAGQYYHIYNRGNNHSPIFFERENYAFFLRQFRQFVSPVAEVIAYCLLPNHYHFLILLKAEDFSHRMQLFSISYTKAINKRFDRTGALFDGAFCAILVDQYEYLLHLSRYIHLNPVRAGIVKTPEAYEFSSYSDYVGLRAGTLPCTEIVLSGFSSYKDYQEFVLGEHPEAEGGLEPFLFRE